MWIKKITPLSNAKEIFNALKEVSETASTSYSMSLSYDGKGHSSKVESVQGEHAIQITKCSGGRMYAIEFVRSIYYVYLKLRNESDSIPNGWIEEEQTNSRFFFGVKDVTVNEQDLTTLSAEMPFVNNSNNIFLPKDAWEVYLEENNYPNEKIKERIIVLDSDQLNDLKEIRSYFGENDKSAFQHKAFAVLDKIIKEAESK